MGRITTPDGTLELLAIEWLEQELPAYNLTVGQTHTYTVDFEQVWVHNACGGEKPDFIVSPNGTVMPTDKDLNLVDANKKDGDWFQIHNKHTDAKVDGSPHVHYPQQHDINRRREIKATDGADLDFADKMLKEGIMRERKNRKDKGGKL